MPDTPITRAEFITLVNNVLERVPETALDILTDEMIKWNDNSNQSAWYYLAIQEATNAHKSENKTGALIVGKQFEYERWLEMKPNIDWLQLEKDWIVKNSTP
jgi:hypothetical protein